MKSINITSAIIKTIFATALLAVSMYVAFCIFKYIEYGTYLIDSGMIYKLLWTSCSDFKWANFACILAYVFRLIIIWAKG